MKKFLILFLMIFALMFAVSCSSSDDKKESLDESSDTGSDQSEDENGDDSADSKSDDDKNSDSGDSGNSGGNGGGSGGDNGGNGGNGGGSDDSDTEEEDGKNNNDDPRADGAEITKIHLKGTSIEVEGQNVTVDGTVATITASGVYEIDGTLSDGQIVVNIDKDKDAEMVNVVFNGMSVTNSKNAPFAVLSAKNARIFTAKDTQNTLTDAASYIFEDPTVDEPNAALYSKDDLKLAGEGTLTVNGNYNDGITSKDDLDINGGTIVVNAKDDGIRGKDSVVIRNGNITVTSGGDGIKSDNTTKLELSDNEENRYENVKGYVKIKGGTLNVTATGGDGIHAISYVEIKNNPTIDITAGGGSIIPETSGGGFRGPGGGGPGGGGPGGEAEHYDGDDSLKGIKASVPDTVENYTDINTNRVFIGIYGGTIKINSRDDGIHSNGNIYIKDSEIEIASDDDGIHADNVLQILAGTINVTNSYEGIEAWHILASDGVTAVYGRDDGWNAAGGNDSSGSSGGPGDWGGGGPGAPGGNGSTGTLEISGGFHYIKTDSGDVDGIDSNGSMTISGGVVVVECQISGGMGGSFDSDGTANITTKTALGFSYRQKSEKGTNYNVSFNTDAIYGNANIAFKPTTSGSYIQSFTGQPSVINDVSGYNVQPFPNGVEVYYKQ